MRIFLQAILYILIAALAVVLFPYVTCPIYKYPEPSVFKGYGFYNPYEKLDSTAWLKANFHAHSRVWWGLTYGKKSIAQELVQRYKELEYDIICISDYQFINPLSDIPVYEHGVGLFKNHQLSLGTNGVTWKDYLLYQNFHHKQNIIASLREQGNLISINHPEMRNAYNNEELVYLRGYDLLEVKNHNYFNALHLWDVVLSTGNPVFLIADDDSHDITNPKDFGFVFTMVNSQFKKPDDIITAMRNGKAVGVELEPMADMSVETKLKQAKEVPLPVSCSIKFDTLTIKFNRPCDTLRLVGQNGRIAEMKHNVSEIKYVFKPEDTYIRAEVNQSTQANVVMNPVFRYDGKIIRPEPEIDPMKTWLFRAACFGAAVMIVGIIVWVKRRRRRKSNDAL